MNFLTLIRWNIAHLIVRFEYTPVADDIGLIIINVSRSNRRRYTYVMLSAHMRVHFVIENYVRIMHRILEGISFPSCEIDNLE